jgi:predicted nucleotidyltransferase
MSESDIDLLVVVPASDLPRPEMDRWEQLRDMELDICTKPELLGTGLHLLLIAQKQS